MKKKSQKKHKKYKYILLSILILLVITTTTYLFINNHQKQILRDIKNHYAKHIITNNKISLYNKNNKKIGQINQSISLNLKKIKTINNKTKYFNIKNTQYYVYYKDIKPQKKVRKEEQINDNYLVFNKNIKTNKKTYFYSQNKKIISLKKGVNLPIQYMDNKYYYVYFLNNILKIKKDKNIKEIESKNTTNKESEYISILHYEKLNDECSENDCTTYENLKQHLNTLKENGYYTITTDNFNDYLNGYIRLKEKAIYITTNIINENTNKINDELKVNIEAADNKLNLKYTSTNKKATKESNKEAIDRYQIKKYTTIENLLKMANGEEIQESEPVIVNNNSNNQGGGGQGIAVLNYHFFYDSNQGETCNEGICLEVSKFREHLEYLKNNGYKTLKMEEFKNWMYGKIELPQKSVLITIDDGAMGTGKHNGNKLIPLLEEYKMNATLFLIAGWWDISNYQSPYLTIQSHTYDMHQYGSCGKGQINCATYEEAKTDLQKSLDIIGNNDSFCFPFYMYSETSLQAVKDMGFKLAFVGGSRKATKNNNKYLIPRYPIHSNITLQQFINMVS